MSLVTGTAFLSLPVCDKCGWPMAGLNEIERHRKCEIVVEGANASALAALFPAVSSTKFGSGTGRLSFDFDEDMHVRFQCSRKRFRLEEVWLLGDLSPDEAQGIVAVLANWRAEFHGRKVRP